MPRYPEIKLNLSDAPVDTPERAAYVKKLLEDFGAPDAREFYNIARGLGPSALIELLDEWVTLE